MSSIDRDLIIFNQLIRAISTEHEAASFKIEALYRLLFEREGERTRTFTPTAAERWDSVALARAIGMTQRIVTEYVRIYEDPRIIPVTHYRRQKKVSIFLDSIFSGLLREAVRRTLKDSFLDDEAGKPLKDAFLDEPILYLKQEARARGFPKTKKGGGVSLKALNERFEAKLLAKGVHLATLNPEYREREDAARNRQTFSP